MIGDLATSSLAFHGTVCGFMWIAVFKLGGESNFGKRPQEEAKELRACLLRSIAVSLVDTFEPILTLANSVTVSTIWTPDGQVRDPAEITKIGKEKLLNAVRDFVKSDIALMKSLRYLDDRYLCITRSLRWLRVSTIVAAIVSGAFTLAAVGLTAGIAVIGVDWPFVAACVLVAAILVSSAFFAVRVTLAVNSLATLKDKHADLS